MPISETYNIDVMEYLNGVEDGAFDLAICDPPYGIGEDGGSFRGRNGQGHRVLEKKDWDKSRPEKRFFDEIFRVSQNQIVWGGNYFTDYLFPSRGWIFWDKLMGGDFSDGELAWASFDRVLRKFTMCNKMHGKTHPTEKPVELYLYQLANYARPGDKIFDPMMGSQSSRIAAWDMGFDYVGCEKDEDYFRDGEARFKKHVANKTTLFAPEQMYNFEQTKLF